MSQMSHRDLGRGLLGLGGRDAAQETDGIDRDPVIGTETLVGEEMTVGTLGTVEDRFRYVHSVAQKSTK